MLSGTLATAGQRTPQGAPARYTCGGGMVVGVPGYRGWVCAIGARSPMPFNTGIRFSKTCTRIAYWIFANKSARWLQYRSTSQSPSSS